jgi:hypothetical protein
MNSKNVSSSDFCARQLKALADTTRLSVVFTLGLSEILT